MEYDDLLDRLSPPAEEARKRLPIPPFPARFLNQNLFGAIGMRWGSSDAAALRRADELTLEELQSMEVTREMARGWAEFYANEARRKPQNPSARGRAVLMYCAAVLLGEEP